MAKSGTWGLENGNKTWNLIGIFLQETNSELPYAAWKSSCGPGLTAFIGSFVLISPLPYPLVLIASSEQAETLLVSGWFLAEQFAALVSLTPWAWASLTLAPQQQRGSRACGGVSGHEPLSEIRARAQRTRTRVSWDRACLLCGGTV